MAKETTIDKLLEHFQTSENITILDIGACDFSEGIMLKQQFPNSEVYGIEADKINFEKNCVLAIEKGINVFNLALGDYNGKITFYPSLFEINQNIEWRFAGSIVKPIFKENSNEAINHNVTYDKEGYEIDVMRLDSFCIRNNISKIDYIHIDVEGAEDRVLSTMGKYKPQLIFAETAHFDTKKYDNKLKSIVSPADNKELPGTLNFNFV